MSELKASDLEQIAHNLCSLHDFDPEFVKGQQRFAEAVITEYLKLPDHSPSAEGEPVAWTGSGSLNRIRGKGREFQGYIYGSPDAAHPIALYAHPSPAPADVAWVGENREAIARIIIGAVYDGDADDLMHGPHQKSWEEPTQRRWEQFLETADEILARMSVPTDPTPEMLAALVEACRPLAEKARRWDETHGADRRDSVQIEHRIGDFRRILEILDRKSCAEGEGQ